MHSKTSFLFLLLFVVAGCAKNYPVDNHTDRINFTEHNLYPEGLAFDAAHNGFLVSSVTTGSVGIVAFDGKYRQVISDANLTSTTGLKVDMAHHRVWVCNAENGIGAYDLRSGKRIFFTDLSAIVPCEPLFINDEAIDPEGNAYVTSSAAPIIFKVSKDGKASVFFHDNSFAVGADEFGFNGIQYDKRGFLLVAHTASNRLIKIPIGSPANYSAVTLDAALATPDGLLLSRDGSQLVVVSGEEVLSFISGDGWKSASVSTKYDAGKSFPTSITSDGNHVFVINSPLDKLLNGEDNDDYSIQQIKLKVAGWF